MGHLATRLSPAITNSVTLRTPFSLKAETVRWPVILSTVPLKASWSFWDKTISIIIPQRFGKFWERLSKDEVWIGTISQRKRGLEFCEWFIIPPIEDMHIMYRFRIVVLWAKKHDDVASKLHLFIYFLNFRESFLFMEIFFLGLILI